MPSLSGKNILLIDDADEIRVLARRILEVDGASVSDAPSIDQGVSIARENVPHLVIVDLSLPEKTGFDFLEFRRTDSLLQGIPAIVLSGNKDRESVQRAISLGANDYIVKPFRATQVLQKIRKALKLTSFYSKKLDASVSMAGSASIPIEITHLSEVACRISSPVKFAAGEAIQLRSNFTDRLGIGDLRMCVSNQAGVYLDAGQYGSEVDFVGIDRDLAARIRVVLGAK